MSKVPVYFPEAASKVSWADSQSGCQSPAQPIAALWEPGSVIDSASIPPGPSAGPAAERSAPTTAVVEAATREPLASVETARYSITVPVSRPRTSWNTRGVSSSAVPSGVHATSPAIR